MGGSTAPRALDARQEDANRPTAAPGSSRHAPRPPGSWQAVPGYSRTEEEATFSRQANRSGKKRNQKNAGYLRNWPGEISRLKAFSPFFLRARAKVEQRLHPLRTKPKCIAVFLLPHFLLLYLLLLQGSGNLTPSFSPASATYARM
jgi:hypothetical protein